MFGFVLPDIKLFYFVWKRFIKFYKISIACWGPSTGVNFPKFKSVHVIKYIERLIIFLVQAFHLKFVEQKVESNISKWNVHIMQLSETKRHMDRAALLKFWEVLDRLDKTFKLVAIFAFLVKAILKLSLEMCKSF